MPKRVGKYEIGKTLGEGTFGKVKYAVNTDTGERVAIKILDKEKIQKQNMGAQIKKEISIMKMVKNRHVVKLYEVLASRTKIFIVLELITGGELFDKIVAEGRFNEDMARFYFKQLCNGVRYCHSQGVCHRDLKPENLLLDEGGYLKISDFGLSALYTGTGEGDTSRTTLLHTTCGTPNYVAPEVLNDKGYDGRAADVWSMGVILYVLLAGFLPFDEPHMSALFRKIQKAEFVYPSWFSTEIRALIDRVLIPDPTKRATLDEIMSDPWMTAGGDSEDGTVDSGAGGGGSDRPLLPTPSAKDMEEAVVDTAEAEGGDDDGPSALNAFEVCNVFGSMALNKLLLTASGDRRNQSTSFFSRAAPRDIMARAAKAGTDLGGEVSTDPGSFETRVAILSNKGEITFTVAVSTMGSGLNFVDIIRGRGDLLEFSRLHRRFRELVADIITEPKPRSGAA
jgi:serine/threonine protein kinase